MCVGLYRKCTIIFSDIMLSLSPALYPVSALQGIYKGCVLTCVTSYVCGVLFSWLLAIGLVGQSLCSKPN